MGCFVNGVQCVLLHLESECISLKHVSKHLEICENEFIRGFGLKKAVLFFSLFRIGLLKELIQLVWEEWNVIS